jgi:hypothetical protein
MTLGEIIKELSKAQPDQNVYYDFADMAPRLELDSYRGDYSETYLGYQEETITVGELLAYLKSRVGEMMCDYKGGNYTIREDKEVWVAKHSGNYTQCLIEKVGHYSSVIIHTKYDA